MADINAAQYEAKVLLGTKLTAVIEKWVGRREKIRLEHAMEYDLSPRYG